MSTRTPKATGESTDGKVISISTSRPEPESNEPEANPEDSSSKFDLSDPSLYLNRELTWLEFNRRVLHEAEDPRVPLLERLKFLAITNSNLDEFIMKRIGGLKQQVGAGLHDRTVDGRTPREQIAESLSVVGEIEQQCRERYDALCVELREHGIFITRCAI